MSPSPLEGLLTAMSDITELFPDSGLGEVTDVVRIVRKTPIPKAPSIVVYPKDSWADMK